MGTSQQHSVRLPKFQRQNWHEAQCKAPLRRQFGQSTLYRNNITNEYIEQYPIYFNNNSQYDKYRQFFEWRQREETIVNARYINIHENSQFCNATHNGLVYIEYIPLRLSAIEDIPYPENLYVLFSALDGFEKIFYFLGYFQPREEMVCIDSNGKIKVWLNADLSRCSLEEGHYGDGKQTTEESMVAEIIQMLERNTCEEVDAEMSFGEFIGKGVKGRGIGFRQAKQGIINYAQAYDTHIPTYFQSIMMVIDEKRESEMEEDQSSRIREEEQKIYERNRGNFEEGTRDRNGQHVRKESFIVQEIVRREDQGRSEIQQPPAVKVMQSMPVSQVMQPGQSQPRREQQIQLQQQIVYSQIQPPPQPQYQPQLQHQRQYQPQSVYVNRQPIDERTRATSAFQVKFNYAGNNGARTQPTQALQPASPLKGQAPPPTAHFLPIDSEKRVNEQIPFSMISQPSFSTTLTPIHKLPQSSLISENRIPEPQNETIFSQVHPMKPQIQASKILYSDTTETYELDDEIATDIFRYFGEVQI